MPHPEVSIDPDLQLRVAGNAVAKLSASEALSLAETMVKFGFRSMMLDEAAALNSRFAPTAGRRGR